MNDRYSWLEYFIFDLKFLREYEPSCVTDKNGNMVDVSDWDKIYDFLVEEGKE